MFVRNIVHNNGMKLLATTPYGAFTRTTHTAYTHVAVHANPDGSPMRLVGAAGIAATKKGLPGPQYLATWHRSAQHAKAAKSGYNAKAVNLGVFAVDGASEGLAPSAQNGLQYAHGSMEGQQPKEGTPVAQEQDTSPAAEEAATTPPAEGNGQAAAPADLMALASSIDAGEPVAEPPAPAKPAKAAKAKAAAKPKAVKDWSKTALRRWGTNSRKTGAPIGMYNADHPQAVHPLATLAGSKVDIRTAPGEGRWVLLCEAHGYTYRGTNMDQVYVGLFSPEDWCEDCKAIFAGKAAKVVRPGQAAAAAPAPKVAKAKAAPKAKAKAAPKAKAKAAAKPTAKGKAAAPRRRNAKAATPATEAAAPAEAPTDASAAVDALVTTPEQA